MSPYAYFDIEVRRSERSGGAQATALPIATKLFYVLHGVFRLHPGRFALAFPKMRMGESRYPGDTLRVFADTRDDLDVVVDALKDNRALSELLRLGYAEKVPEDYAGRWMEYRRYRVPGTGSRLDKCRSYRLEASEKLPYFRTASKSTGQSFVVFVECRDGAASRDCEPDGYGLSVATRPFAVPMLP
ncbi:MAG TPA: type I-F CRISPR-associated endoribonuclease Cas6/Csy4 [Rhodocyclaceae bacterium]|nr:type I-F CRISPR-associated endoribonuclease Cas6/Csy4 [Rhodocyclaceae bacterium]